MRMLSVLAASLLVMLVSLSGKLLAVKGLGPLVERNLHFLVSFAAGVLLVVAWSLSREIVEHAGSLTTGLPWIAAGAVAVFLAFRYVPHFHHHHEKSEHAHSRLDANRILASDAIHNVGDGVVIVVSFAASPLVGALSTASILIHETLQEISEFFVLREAGLTVNEALVRNFLASSTILVGAIGAFFLLDRFEALEVPLLGLSAGAYLVVVFHDLLPHSFSNITDRAHLLQHAIYFTAGLLMMALAVLYVPHA